MTLRLSFPVMLFLAGLPACVGTDTGNPPVTTSLTARSSDPTVALDPATGDIVIERIVIERAWISLSEVRVTLGELCDHVSEPYDEDVVGDLIGGLPLAGLPEGPTCGVHLSLVVPTEVPADAPVGFADRSLWVEGRLADGARFEISSDYAMGINVGSATLFELPPAAGALVVFDLARWVGGFDLSASPRDPDGVIRIGPGDAEYSAFESAFIGSVELYADANADGVLDPLELAAGPLASSHMP